MRRFVSRLPWLACALVLATPTVARAQYELIALDRVHELYTEGQPRQAAQALAQVSASFRTEIGRCKDPDIGAQLIELEPRMDALVRRLGTGGVADESVLRREFAVYDRLLAENHLQLAQLAWSQRRNGRVDLIGRELDLAARYAERSARWARRSDAAASTVQAARAVAARMIDEPMQAPSDAERQFEALGTWLRGQR